MRAKFLLLLAACAVAANIRAQMPDNGQPNYDYAFGDNVYNLPEARIAYAGDTIKANAFVVYRYDEASDEYSKLMLKIQLWPEGSGCACVKKPLRPVSAYGRHNTFICHQPLDNKGRVHTFEGAADVFATAAVAGDTPEYATAGLKYKVTFDPYDRAACKAEYTIEKAAWQKANFAIDEARKGWSYNNPKGGVIRKFKYSLNTFNSGNNKTAFDNSYDVEFIGFGVKETAETPVRYDSILLSSSISLNNYAGVSSYMSSTQRANIGDYIIVHEKIPVFLRETSARIRQGYPDVPKPSVDKDPYVEVRMRCKPIIVGEDIVSEVSSLSNILHY